MISECIDTIEYEQEFYGDIAPSITIPDNARILIISRDQSFLTHGIHKFPAKFFPELPRYLIRRYSDKGQTVLDPMCGSGTVVLESLLAQRMAVGIDIDPMAHLITKVKTTPIKVTDLQGVQECLRDSISNYEHSDYEGINLPQFHYRDTWFKPFVLEELAAIREAIGFLPSSYNNQIIDFLRVVFSSIIRDVSNADPHCTRTVIRKKLRKNIHSGDTTARFFERLTSQVEAMASFVKTIKEIDWMPPQLFSQSATGMSLESSSIDLAITSPPYINAVDYPRTHQLEMYWLGLIEDGPLAKMKRKYLGTETVYQDEYADLQVSGLASLDPILETIYHKDPRRSFIVFKFFQDMKLQLAETYRVLRPGGRYCIAIGNNLIRGVRVESHKILSEIASSPEVGFDIERSFFSGIIRHFIKIPRKERMHGEWVIILQKPQ